MTASRIVRPDTAFSMPGKQRRKREKNEAHLAHVRKLPCAICGQKPVEAAHIRMAAPEYGKRETGMAEKPDDCWTMPLCPHHHREQHGMNEEQFWQDYGMDPIKIALALNRASGDEEAGTGIILAHIPKETT